MKTIVNWEITEKNENDFFLVASVSNVDKKTEINPFISTFVPGYKIEKQITNTSKESVDYLKKTMLAKIELLEKIRVDFRDLGIISELYLEHNIKIEWECPYSPDGKFARISADVYDARIYNQLSPMGKKCLSAGAKIDITPENYPAYPTILKETINMVMETAKTEITKRLDIEALIKDIIDPTEIDIQKPNPRCKGNPTQS